MFNKQALQFFLIFTFVFVSLQVSHYLFPSNAQEMVDSQSELPVDQASISPLDQGKKQTETMQIDLGNFSFLVDQKTGSIGELTIKRVDLSKTDGERVSLLFQRDQNGSLELLTDFLSTSAGIGNLQYDQITVNQLSENSFSVVKKNSTFDVEQTLVISGDFTFKTETKISNKSALPQTVYLYNQFVNRNNGGIFHSGLLDMFQGASFYNNQINYQKVPLKKFSGFSNSAINQVSERSWMSFSERYFVTAVKLDYPGKFYVKTMNQNNTKIAGHISEPITLSANDTKAFQQETYAGPEIYTNLANFAPKLELVIDYGFFWPVAKACMFGMAWFYQLIPNWGISIILVTCVIKLLFVSFNTNTMKSMKRLKELSPGIEEIKNKYANDPTRMSLEVMEFYKRNNVNPLSGLSGCLVAIMQIPFFMAFYAVLRESVELRHAPFFGWIQDLSVKDPYYVLPVLMGLTMYIQQKLSPRPTDETQAMVFDFFPIIFTFAFLNLPSGLVLYWTTSSVLSLIHLVLVNGLPSKNQ